MRFWGCLATFVALVATVSFAVADPLAALPVTELRLATHGIRAEVADTHEARMTGLMFRTFMPPNDGMLFVFERPDKQCMWMRNTLIPLAVAFIAEDGRILNIEQMRPQTDDPHCSSGFAKYALEMNSAWFSQRNLSRGETVCGGPIKCLRRLPR